MARKNWEAMFEKFVIPNLKPGMKILEIAPERQLTIKSMIDKHLNKNYHYYYTNLVKEEMDKIVQGKYDKDKRWKRQTDINPDGWVECIDDYNYDVVDNSFDVVFSGNVSEHVREIWTWMKEQHRIIKPGGFMVCHNPQSEPYHEDPIDCWRIFPEGMKALIEWAGFKHIGSAYEHLKMDEGSKFKHFETIGVGQKI